MNGHQATKQSRAAPTDAALSSGLASMSQTADLEAFELSVMEACEAGGVNLADLRGGFRKFERTRERDRVAALGRMVLETVGENPADPAALLDVTRVTLVNDPKNDSLREKVVGLYRTVHADTPGFEDLLEISGIESGRPARNAIRLLQMCLESKEGDTLISRTDGTIVEVIDVDIESALFVLRRGSRPSTVPALDVSREFEAIDGDDFRVLRQLRPDSLGQVLKDDPVSVVIGLLHANDGLIDQDTLKHELVPRFIENKDWAKWWTRTRTLLKRCPNVTLEGRAPVVMQYTAEAQTLEDETRQRFETSKDPVGWLDVVESYLREKTARKEAPDDAFLANVTEKLHTYIEKIRSRRPADALAAALVGEKIQQDIGGSGEDDEQLAIEMLKAAETPAALIARQENDSLWELALTALEKARPEETGVIAAQLFDRGPATKLDRLAAMAAADQQTATVQEIIDAALESPVDHAEVIYWLWKGPSPTEHYTFPEDQALFAKLIETLDALGRSLHPDDALMRNFRGRIRTAFGLRDYGRASECIRAIDDHRAVTLRTQLERLEGMGDNVRARFLDVLRETHPRLWLQRVKVIEPWMDEDVLWSTASGIRSRREERDQIENVEIPDNQRRIGAAAEMGDLSENSEYKFALEERDLLRARLLEMDRELGIASSIEIDNIPTEKVGIGSRVRVRDTATNEERVFTFLGPFDVNVNASIYSYKAPLSQQFMGLKIGDRTSATLDGKPIEFEVVEITNSLLQD